MNRTSYPFLLLLALIAAASGYLMSKASWIGKVGITFFHKGYNLIKIWWQGAVAVFLFFMILMAVHGYLQRKAPGVMARLLHIFILLLVVAGLYLTYDDFHTDITHRLMGHRFHYGFYLVWVGWALIALFFIFKGERKRPNITYGDRTGKEYPRTS